MISLEDIPSAVNADEIEFLVRHAKNAKRGIIEIGSSFGKSSVALGWVAKEKGLPMICVDTWPEIDDFPTWRKNIETAGLMKTVMPLHLPSLVAAEYVKYWFEGRFDFLFIDADHSYEAVTADFEKWVPPLHWPATVVFHDIAVPSFGVGKLWGELTAEYEHESFYNIGAIFLP